MGNTQLFLLYVNDLLVTGDNSAEIHRIISHLQSTFDMTNLGAAHLYLGCDID